MFGSLLLVMFPKAVISTISIATQQTTHSLTLSACQPENTLVSGGKQTPVESARLPERKPKNGTSPKKAGFGTSAMQSEAKAGSSGSVKKSLALCVASTFKRLLEKAVIHRFTALTTAKPKRIVSVERLKTKSDVWCITVPDAGEFSLANGALVHNCDAFRYACLVWREEMKPKAEPAIRWPGDRTIAEIIKRQTRKRLEE